MSSALFLAVFGAFSLLSLHTSLGPNGATSLTPTVPPASENQPASVGLSPSLRKGVWTFRRNGSHGPDSVLAAFRSSSGARGTADGPLRTPRAPSEIKIHPRANLSRHLSTLLGNVFDPTSVREPNLPMTTSDTLDVVAAFFARLRPVRERRREPQPRFGPPSQTRETSSTCRARAPVPRRLWPAFRPNQPSPSKHYMLYFKCSLFKL